MSRIVQPPVDELDRLRQPLTTGERQVFDLFDRELPLTWEIYIQPHLNGLRPDFVLLNPAVGIAVFEVKDWNLDAVRYHVGMDHDSAPVLLGEREGQRWKVRDNPALQVNRYKHAIFNLYCPRLQQKSGLAAITAGIIFPFADAARVTALLTPFLKPPATYQPVSGSAELAAGDVGAIFPTSQWSRSTLMSEELADDLRGWLVEPDFSRTQRQRLPLDSNQRPLAEGRTTSGLRRIRGAAGSGKSLVLAARAARLADEGKSVLVVTFNITLMNYLRDLVVRDLTQPGASRNIEYRHFQGWCRELCERAGWEDRYNALFARLPKARTGADTAERRQLEQQRIAMQREIDDELLPDLVIAAAKELQVGYDAILVDEGQDFRPTWWNALRRTLIDGGEMLLVADATQNIYGTARAWTDEAMSGAGFQGGRWAQLSTSYRLPPRALTAARAFAERFLPADTLDLPAPRQLEFDQYTPCLLRWVQCAPEDALDRSVRAILALMKATGTPGVANADITFLAETIGFGTQVVAALDALNIRSRATFAEVQSDRRREKMGFFMGSERIKATTLHSFKGWEARLLVIHVGQALGEQGLALVYTALTRLKASRDGSWLTVVCSAPELAAFGAAHFDTPRRA